MATTLVGEQSAGQSALRTSGGIPILDETFHFLVRSDTTNENRLTVLLTTGLPQVGISVSANYAVCRTVTAVRREEQRTLWDVTATFSSEVDESQNNQSQPDEPTVWVPIYETKFERLQEIVTKDYNDEAVANSAKQPFETGLIRARFIPIWEFFQFESDAITDEQVLERNEIVNSDEFKGRAAHTLLCTVLSSVVGFYYGRRLRLTKYALRYNAKNWKNKRLDVGTVYLENGELKPYEDKGGNVILGGLDGSGGKQFAGEPPATLEFAMYPEVSFSGFLRI
jgi:hypothetical protein